MRIWAITDGKPGHDTHTRGFVRAIEGATDQPAETSWIGAALRLKLLRRALGNLQNGTGNGLARLVALSYRTGRLPDEAPDAIVSSGGDTLYLNAALARKTGAPNFFAGSLRGLSGRFFALTTAPLPRNGEGKHVATGIPLSDFDQGAVLSAGAPLRARLGGGPLWAVLIGGDGGGARFRRADWRALGAGLAAAAKSRGARLLIATSRRTGATGEAALRAAVPGSLIADAAWWSAANKRVVPAYLGASDLAICTADSMSMIAEAVAAGRPVLALAPAVMRPPSRDADVLAGLDGNRLIVWASIGSFVRDEGGPAVERASVLRPLAAPPWKTIAEEIARLGLFSERPRVDVRPVQKS